MKVLEARFHPEGKCGATFIVVGHVAWEEGCRNPSVQPSPDLLGSDQPPTLLPQLQCLVEGRGRESYECLRQLTSEFWSFVDIGSSSPGIPFGEQQTTGPAK
jgi:hypothetical protein